MGRRGWGRGGVGRRDGLSVSVIECWNIFLRAFVAQSIQRFPGELICISRISLLANSDVSNSGGQACAATDGGLWTGSEVIRRGAEINGNETGMLVALRHITC